MPKATRLLDVTGRLDIFAAQKKGKNPGLAFDHAHPLSLGLQQLPFGGRK